MGCPGCGPDCPHSGMPSSPPQTKEELLQLVVELNEQMNKATQGSLRVKSQFSARVTEFLGTAQGYVIAARALLDHEEGTEPELLTEGEGC